jgi:23S rRNA pseudouridine1911/1915/1917 synthase
MDEAEPQEFVEIPFTVEPNYAGWRLDRYLCEKIRRLSRTRVQHIIRHGLVSDRPLKPSTLVSAGLTFRLRKRARVEPQTPDEVTELYRDEALLVLDKPAGLPMHPTARYHRGTLVSLIERRYGKGFRADPAHRLDRETSGIVVCGRTLHSCQRLMRSFVAGQVHKEYLAITEGAPPEDAFEVDAPIAEGTARIRIAVRIDPVEGKPARTRFEVLRRFERDGARFALLRALPRTGRQHQIRIHLQLRGFPLVGDKMYGPDPDFFDRFSRGELESGAWARLRLPRHALHAAGLTLPHPTTGASMRFDAPLPADLAAFLAR